MPVLSWSRVNLQFCACLQLIRLWHIHTAYLTFYGFYCHRGYCRRLSTVPCADREVLPEYLLQIQISVYIWQKGKKERDNPSGLYITDTDYRVYVSPDVLTSLFLGNFWLCRILRVTFCVVNLFLCISFCILPTRDIICYCLSPSDWFCLVYDPPRSILVTISSIISVAIFHDWVIVHCVYVHIFFNLWSIGWHLAGSVLAL